MPRKQSLLLDLGAVAGAHEELPPLAALFLIHFDTKKGYTIEWSRTVDGVDLDGVEFKSLPSGLHRLQEDLVYFVHGSYAGLSAFLNVETSEEERGALMVCAGILAPLSYGRLGRSWRHAEGLKALARRYTEEPTTARAFEEYYEQHHLKDNRAGPIAPATTEITANIQPAHVRSRSMSETRLGQGCRGLSRFHPALSLAEFVDTFGPLVFPLYRAALARKRILLVGQPPVETACSFVYDISILSNIPLSVADMLPSEPSRLKPLFNVGVHDTPLLEQEARKRAEAPGAAAAPATADTAAAAAADAAADAEHGAWVACTTDEILSIKQKLWDVVVHLPPAHAKKAREKVWPTVQTSQGTAIKATQRDLRRFRALMTSIKQRYHHKRTSLPNPPSTADDGHHQDGTDDADDADDDDDDDDGAAAEESSNIESVCEKLTWREIAVSGFMWWASAGEQRSAAEADDGRLLMEPQFSCAPDHSPNPHPHRAAESEAEHQGTTAATATAAHGTSSSTASLSGTRRRPAAGMAGVAGKRQSINLQQEGAGCEEMDLIAYFHRMTQRTFSVLADNVHGADEDDDEEDDGEDEEERLLKGGEVHVSLGDMERMGLDRYSDRDAELVAELVARWWGRTARVERGRISCCGVECG